MFITGASPQFMGTRSGPGCKYLNKKNYNKGGQRFPHPLLYVTPIGVIAAVLSEKVLLEITVDESFRLVHFDQFAVFMNGRGTSSSITHGAVRVRHSNQSVLCRFNNITQKFALIGDTGVLFTMDHLMESYLVNQANGKGATALSHIDHNSFPNLVGDLSMKQMREECVFNESLVKNCREIVKYATHEILPDGTINLHINGLSVRHTSQGSVYISGGSGRHIGYNSTTATLTLRSSSIEIGIEDNGEKAHVKRGSRRVHVSKSGMVVSDSGCNTAMDHLGRIITCT